MRYAFWLMGKSDWQVLFVKVGWGEKGNIKLQLNECKSWFVFVNECDDNKCLAGQQCLN